MELLRPIKINKRKSGFEDAFFVMAVLFTIAIFILILAKVWNDIKDPLDEGISGSFNSTDLNVTQNFDRITSTINLFGSLMPFLLIGLFAFVFIGTSIYMKSPVMIVVGIIVLGIAILLGSIYANIYHQISGSDEFTEANDALPIPELFMQYLPFIILLLFVGITIAIIFLRGQSGGGL